MKVNVYQPLCTVNKTALHRKTRGFLLILKIEARSLADNKKPRIAAGFVT